MHPNNSSHKASSSHHGARKPRPAGHSHSTGGHSSYSPTQRIVRTDVRGFSSGKSFGGHSGYKSHGSYGGGHGGHGGHSRFGGGSRPRFGGRSRGGKKNFGQYIDVSRFVNKAEITEKVENFVPDHKFTDFAIDERIKKNILDRGYNEPTPIQDRAIPHVLRGVDVVGIANTGTGKTAAFIIPLLHKVLSYPKERILIMVPTRELAIQIEDELWGFAKGFDLYSACCVGGAPIGKQIAQLRKRPEFVIGTPGRLKDLIEKGMIRLPEFKTLVLDEADRMLDMGFINDVRGVVSSMDKDRHTLFFSATLSKEIEKLIHEFLKNPVSISVKTQDTSKNVDQDVVRVPAGKTKMDVLDELLKKSTFAKVLVFGRTKHGVEKLTIELVRRGFRAESIHGNKNHAQRQRSLTSFKSGHAPILVATDVAARGLDISGITHVINFDVPATYEDYVHRIGRTGRGGKKGHALTFID